jgi:hypothetical protein
MSTFMSEKIRVAVQAAVKRNNISLDNLVHQTKTRGAEADKVLDFNFGGLFGKSESAKDKLISVIGYVAKIDAAFKQKRDQFPGFGNATTDILSDHNGFYQHFEHGSIFWRDGHGLSEVHGAIRDKYASLGWQHSYLGYPTTDELSTTHAGIETRYNDFEHGVIEWTSDGGASISMSLSAKTEGHQLGYWIYLSGQGFTPGGTIRFSVEGLANFQGAKSIGLFAVAKTDGTFSDVTWDGRTWPDGGRADIRALDQSTGKSVTVSIPALY